MTAPAPLSARSAVLSLVLGSGPDGLTSAQLAAAARHLSINPATVRVALSRAVAADELLRDGSRYRLGARLRERRARQEARAAVEPWDGTWETAVVVSTGRSAADRATLRSHLTTARLAELREGVWMRPANLRLDRLGSAPDDVLLLTSTPHTDPARLAARLWDLDDWATGAAHLLTDLAATTAPGSRLAVAAQLVRHLSDDPLLPDDLQPSGWPAAEARAAYERYSAELHAFVTG